jgi:hypothetical protein
MHRLILLPGTGVRASQKYGGVGRDIDAQTDPPPRYRGQRLATKLDANKESTLIF